MASQPTTRINVQLDAEHSAKLHAVAERAYIQPGTLARSLLSQAIDELDPDASRVTDLLDRIPGAFERAQARLVAARAGKVIGLDEL